MSGILLLCICIFLEINCVTCCCAIAYDLNEDVFEVISNLWKLGSFAGKCLIAVCIVSIGLLFLPTVLVVCFKDKLINLVHKLGFYFTKWLFPGMEYTRVEIPMQSSDVLQTLRDNSCEFTIGRDCIAFTCWNDYKAAKKYLNTAEYKVVENN